jgi:hypothetical protein
MYFSAVAKWEKHCVYERTVIFHGLRGGENFYVDATRQYPAVCLTFNGMDLICFYLHNPPMRLLALFLLFSSLTPLPAEAAKMAKARSPSVFDKALAVKRVPLKPDPLNPSAKAVLQCAYYTGFMVKQIDLGEKGADQLHPAAGRCSAARLRPSKRSGGKNHR